MYLNIFRQVIQEIQGSGTCEVFITCEVGDELHHIFYTTRFLR
jgi:hypothetical protein